MGVHYGPFHGHSYADALLRASIAVIGEIEMGGGGARSGAAGTASADEAGKEEKEEVAGLLFHRVEFLRRHRKQTTDPGGLPKLLPPQGQMLTMQKGG